MVKIKHDIPTQEERERVRADWRANGKLPWYQKFRETPLAIVEENEMPQWKTPKQVWDAVTAMGTNFVRYPTIGWAAHFFKESKALPKYKGMKPEEDFYGDVCNYFHERGGMVCAYNHFGGVMYGDVYEKHPDWVFRNKDGTPFMWNGMHYIGCLSNDDFVNAMLTGIEEECSLYPTDAVYLDAPGWYVQRCYCDSCKKAWRELYNEELPDIEAKTSEDLQKLLNYREIRMFNLVKAVHEITESHGIPLIINTRGQQDENNRFGNKELNLIYTEGANAGEGYRPKSDFWKMMTLWRLGEAEKRISYAYCPIGPYYNLRSHGVDETLVSGMAEAMYGTTPFVESATSYLFDKTGGEALKQVCTNIKEHANMYYRTQPVRDLAVVVSPTALTNVTSVQHKILQNEFDGLVELLAKSNRQFDCVFETQLNDERLDGYRAIYLPQAGYMSERTENILKNFVSKGGNVICGAEFSRQNDKNEILNEYLHSDFIGVDFIAENDRTFIDKHSREYRETSKVYPYAPIPEAYVKVVKDLNGMSKDSPIVPISDQVVRVVFPVDIFYIKANPRKDTEVLAEFYLPAGGERGDALEFPEGNPPAITRKKYGKGYVYWLGFRPGFSYTRQGSLDIQKLIVALCDTAVGGPVIDYKCKGLVPCFYVEDKDGVRYLHLTNMTGPMHERSIMIDNVAPLYQIKFKVKEEKPISSVCTVYGKQDLPFERKDGYIYFTLPKLEIYESIEIK